MNDTLQRLNELLMGAESLIVDAALDDYQSPLLLPLTAAHKSLQAAYNILDEQAVTK